MRPFQVQRIDHVVLRVRDAEASIAFYRDVLGCTIERRREHLGLVHLRAGASMIDLVTLDGPLGQPGGRGPGAHGRNVDHVALRIEPFDVDALLAHLHAHGLAPQGAVEDNFGAEGDGPSIYISDPDGNRIELKGPSRS